MNLLERKPRLFTTWNRRNTGVLMWSLVFAIVFWYDQNIPRNSNRYHNTDIRTSLLLHHRRTLSPKISQTPTTIKKQQIITRHSSLYDFLTILESQHHNKVLNCTSLQILQDFPAAALQSGCLQRASLSIQFWTPYWALRPSAMYVCVHIYIYNNI